MAFDEFGNLLASFPSGAAAPIDFRGKGILNLGALGLAEARVISETNGGTVDLLGSSYVSIEAAETIVVRRFEGAGVGAPLLLVKNGGAADVVIKHDLAAVNLFGDADRTLAVGDALMLIFSDGVWLEVGAPPRVQIAEVDAQHVKVTSNAYESSTVDGALGEIASRRADRAALAAKIASGWVPAVGWVEHAGGLAYRYIGTGTVIGDMPGWIWQGDVTPEHHGAIGDNVADDTAAFLSFAAAALDGAAVIPRPMSRYRLTATVNLRNIKLDAKDAWFRIDHDGIGIILGGRSNTGVNPRQHIHRAERAAGRAVTSPIIRIVGAKGAEISVDYCPWVQLWAEGQDGTGLYSTDGSIAYSTFNFLWVDKLTLEAPEPYGGWINENTFNLKRCHTLLLQGSTQFRHNHNHFYHGTFENTSSLTFNRAADNKLYGMRFEVGPTTVGFGTAAERNTIWCDWAGSEFSPAWPNGPGTNVTITDTSGFGSSRVLNENASYRDPIVVAVADCTDTVFDQVSNSLNPLLPKRAATRQRVSGAFGAILAISNHITADPTAWFTWDWQAIPGETPQYIAGVYFYDRNGKQLAPQAGWLSSSQVTTIEATRIRSSDKERNVNARVTAAAISAGVATVRVAVLGASVTALQKARRVTVTLWQVAGTTDRNQPAAPRFEPLVVSNRPTQGFARYADMVSKTGFTERYHVTLSLQTALTADTATSSTSISVADSTFVAAGDIVGVDLDNFETHWTTVASVMGTTITLADGIPSEAVSGSAVYFIRWRTENYSVTP